MVGDYTCFYSIIIRHIKFVALCTRASHGAEHQDNQLFIRQSLRNRTSMPICWAARTAEPLESAKEAPVSLVPSPTIIFAVIFVYGELCEESGAEKVHEESYSHNDCVYHKCCDIHNHNISP